MCEDAWVFFTKGPLLSFILATVCVWIRFFFVPTLSHSLSLSLIAKQISAFLRHREWRRCPRRFRRLGHDGHKELSKLSSVGSENSLGSNIVKGQPKANIIKVVSENETETHNFLSPVRPVFVHFACAIVRLREREGVFPWKPYSAPTAAAKCTTLTGMRFCGLKGE